MPKPVPVPVRRMLYQRAQQGESTASLAAAFALPLRTVRHLLRRFHDRGPDGLPPDYRKPGGLPHAYPDAVREAALDLRRRHPTWGSVLIGIALRQHHPQGAVPASSTLRRWFHGAGLGPPPAARRPRPPRARATRPHQTWQIDACERIGLANGTQVCWLRVVDEATGAVLGTAIFPPSPLESGRAPGYAGGPAWPVRAVGPARADAGRQRHALGLAWRPAHRPGLVAGGPGRRCAEQSAATAPGQRRHRAVPGGRPVLGRAWFKIGFFRVTVRTVSVP
jgi:hypothetical protein